MMKEWTDRMAPGAAIELWQRQIEEEVTRRTARIERELRDSIARERLVPTGFYEAMRHFLTLRDRLFPGMPTDGAWKILVALALTDEDSGKCSVTGLAHGADVPMSTAIRYIAAMEAEGVVERVPHPGDRRQVIIRLTSEGRRRLDEVAGKWATRLMLALLMPAAAILWVGVLLGAA